MKVKSKIQLIKSLMKCMQESFDGEVPPSIVMYSEKYGIMQMIFQKMDNQKEKTEIAISGMLLAALVGDVEIIAVVSEAWGISLDPVKNKDVFDACGGDHNKISNYLHKKWPTFEDCPFRNEMFMASVCDGTDIYVINQDIEYDDNGKRLNKELNDDDCKSHMKSSRDFNVTFNSLLCKSEMFKDAFTVMKELPFYPGHITLETQEMVVQRLTDHVGYDIDIKKVVSCVNQAFEGAKSAYQESNAKPDGAVVH